MVEEIPGDRNEIRMDYSVQIVDETTGAGMYLRPYMAMKSFWLETLMAFIQIQQGNPLLCWQSNDHVIRSHGKFCSDPNILYWN